MQTRPIYRSITFWSGALALAFLCWAWGDSTNHHSSMRWNCFMAQSGHGGLEINSVYSFTGFSASRMAKPTGTTRSQMPEIVAPFFLRGTGSPTVAVSHKASESYREELETMMRRRSPEAWLIFIPHWIPLLSVALLWVVLLVWRERRVRASATHQTLG